VHVIATNQRDKRQRQSQKRTHRSLPFSTKAAEPYVQKIVGATA